jgi:hypothetical protein
VRLTQVQDTLKVDAQQGFIRHLESQETFQIRQQAWGRALRLALQEIRTLEPPTLKQRLRELQSVRAIQQSLHGLEEPSQEDLARAEQAIGRFQQRFQKSPYLLYVKSLRSIVAIVRRQVEREQRKAQLVGKAAPAFDLPTLKDERLRLADLKGRVVLVNFFAHW